MGFHGIMLQGEMEHGSQPVETRKEDYRPDQSLSDRVSGAHLLLSTLLLFEINYFIEGKKKVQKIRVEIFIARQEAEAEEADLPSRKSPLILSHDS